MSKGGFGAALGVLSVPILALVISPIQAAAIMLPLLVAMDIVALWSFRGTWSKKNIAYMIPGAILGIVIGAFGFRYLSEDAIRILIGVIAMVFCINAFIKRGSNKISKPNKVSGSFWGMISGFTSFGLHAGGPPAGIYLLPQQMEKKLLMGTTAIFFAIVNFVKLVPYALLGQFNGENLTTSLVLIPFAIIGVRLGYYLLNKVSQQLIYQIAYISLAIIGLKLLWEGLLGVFVIA